jgi:hypothetical protein
LEKVAELKDLPGTPPPRAFAASPGSALWLKIILAQRLLNSAAQRFWSRPDLTRLFPSFLRELYSLVSCSVPLMSAARERAAELATTDPLAARTAEYLKQHIEEERHHDEWLLDDLVASGMDRASVLSRYCSASVASLIGAQYCWIHHAHPSAIFGYLAVIEGNPPLSEHLHEIQLQTGYPPEAFRCLHLHAADDIEHLEELRMTIAGLPLKPEHEKLITMSAFATVEAVSRIFEELVANAQPGSE